jgi:DNA-3-methyladenine glycosylase II
MDPKLRRRFLRIAGQVSPQLRAKLRQAGATWFPEREDKGVVAFLARAVVGQQLSTHAARSIWTRLEAAATGAGGELHGFFHADNAERLRACGLSRAKVKALAAIRDAHEAGKLSAADIRAMAHPDRARHLTQIRGVGPWTCDMLAIFYCRDADIWPDGDSAAHGTLKRLIGRRKPAKVAALFAPHRSILALYMWKIADGVP